MAVVIQDGSPTRTLVRSRAAQIGSRQNRTEDGRTRNGIDHDAHQLQYADGYNRVLRLSVACKTFNHGGRLHKFHDRAQQQQKNWDRAQNASGPNHLL